MKYFERRKKAKLHKQWVERAGLPSKEVTPKPDKSDDIIAQITRPESKGSRASGPVQVMPGSSVVTHADVTGDMMEEIDRRELRLRLPYVLLGASLVVLCVVLIVLIVLSC